MRVAIVAECFLPQRNGVATTIAKLARHLATRGHDAVVIAPGPGAEHAHGVRVVRVRSMGVPGHRESRLGVLDWDARAALERFAPDVVHLAAPVLLGRQAGRLAVHLGVPVIAAFQTDLAGFARRYG